MIMVRMAMIMVRMTMIMVIISMLQIKIMKNKMLQITFNLVSLQSCSLDGEGRAAFLLSLSFCITIGKACLVIRLLMGFGTFWQLFKGCLLT